VRLAAFLAVVFGLVTLAAQEPIRTADITLRGLKPTDFPRITTLAPNVYAYEQIDPTKRTITANNLIVVTTDGVLVADGQGTVANTTRLVADIAKLTPQPIRYVVIGSEHGDHRGGDSAFPQSATFIAHPYSQANLRRQSENQRPGGARVVVPTETVSDKRVLMLGGTEVQLLFLGRAHTGGDLEVYLPAEKILFASEVFTNRIFPSMRTAYPSEWIATLEKVAAIDATTIVPGHGFVEEPATLRSDFAAFRRATGSVVAEAMRLHQLGLSVRDAVAQARWGEYGTWTGRDRNAPIAIQRVYDEMDGKLK